MRSSVAVRATMYLLIPVNNLAADAYLSVTSPSLDCGVSLNDPSSFRVRYLALEIGESRIHKRLISAEDRSGPIVVGI